MLRSDYDYMDYEASLYYSCSGKYDDYWPDPECDNYKNDYDDEYDEDDDSDDDGNYDKDCALTQAEKAWINA